MICAEPAGSRTQVVGSSGREAAEAIGRGLSALHPRAAIEAGPGPVRAAVPLGGGTPERVEELLRSCHELGERSQAAIGVSQLREGRPQRRTARPTVRRSTRRRSDERCSARVARSAYSQLGAYRYLVHIAADDAPTDRMRAAVDVLIRVRQPSALSVARHPRALPGGATQRDRKARGRLFIHPNTLRQRLSRGSRS